MALDRGSPDHGRAPIAELRQTLIDLIAGAESAADRLRHRVKRRLDRFGAAEVLPFRSYGRPDLLVLRGRVLEERRRDFHPDPGVWTNIRHAVRSFRTDEIPGAVVRARARNVVGEATADEEGYYEIRLAMSPPLDPGWHEVRLEVTESMASASAPPVMGEVLVAPPDGDYVVVSDLDDTVLHSAATNKLAMASLVLLNDARSRTPFEGVAHLYRALQAGPSGHAQNPILYLSRSPTNLYDMIVEFMAHHHVPPGPLLLMDWGLRGLLERSERDYKRAVLERLLTFYPGQRFVLVGDSGQQDPEIYARLAEEHPHRIAAIVIRDVADRTRDLEVRTLADRVERAGVPMALVADSAGAEQRLAGLGLLPARAPEESADPA